MKDFALKLENVSKKYTIGEKKEDNLRGTINSLFSGLNKPQQEFWALENISFEVEKGDMVGVIGQNGAGKSTLLKILSQITRPTKGRIEINGRIASLLEVGTGFHQELTGRENIYLNGTILGMSRREVTRKFDEIVSFSGVEKFIDTPVKHYSSGMRVRLAFAVAAHLEPEILLIDEVLSVGDADFQKKSLGKMKEVAHAGRTVLFVSHNMAAIRNLCERGILLKKGKMVFSGSSEKAVQEYLKHSQVQSNYHCDNIEDALGNENIKVLDFTVSPAYGDIISISTGMNVSLTFFNFKAGINLDVTFELRTVEEMVVFRAGKIITSNNNSENGFYDIAFEIPSNLLNAGNYYFRLIFGESQRYLLYESEGMAGFEVQNENIGSNSSIQPGIMRPAFDFKIARYISMSKLKNKTF